jgi:ribosomal protein S18 acetylase RimI-like enzyme
MIMSSSKLDNPVWFSLTETHQNKSIDYDGVKFYNTDYCPFGGFIDIDKTAGYLEEYSHLVSNFYVVGHQPKINSSVILKKELVCNQMLLENSIDIDISEEIVQLDFEHKDLLFDLVNLVQPGYFKSKTFELGNYYGIHKDNQLVAVTGERMKMNSFTEISAVVTHPKYTGNGFAKKLVAYTSNNIFLQNRIPYLHVAENNEGAISLYKRLGFEIRRKISFWNYIKTQ